MVTLNRIYTRVGDSGETGLGDGSRISKASIRIAAIGAVDEANAAIGIARLAADAGMQGMLARIQNDLFDLGADLCVPLTGRRGGERLRISQAQVDRLEAEIDAMNAGLSPLNSFVLPGGTPAAAHLHLARAIVRRAERQMVALVAEESLSPESLSYINRLSDHLFVAARSANSGAGGDVLWTPGENR
jgi:cob(I)alamin adenosyltransferase